MGGVQKLQGRALGSVTGHRVGRLGARDTALHDGLRHGEPYGRYSAAEDPASLRHRPGAHPVARAFGLEILVELRGGAGGSISDLLRRPHAFRAARVRSSPYRSPRHRGRTALGLIYCIGAVRLERHALPHPDWGTT